jgi:hypothetical protein
MTEEGLEGMVITGSIDRKGGGDVHQRAEATEYTGGWGRGGTTCENGGGDTSTIPKRSGLGRL